MGRRREDDVVKEALSRIRRRIEGDRKEQPKAIQRVLAHVSEHLLDSGLNAETALRAGKITSRSFTTAFGEKIGLSLHKYITELRIEMACDLLRETDLAIWQVARRVGYTVDLTFTRAFKRQRNSNPTEYREGFRKQAATEGSEVVPDDTLRRIRSGDAEVEEVRTLVNQLRKKYPAAFQGAGPVVTFDADKILAGKAQEVWEILRDRRPEEHYELLNLWRFTDSSLFDLLLEKSITEGRADRRRGLHLAELALYSLELSRGVLRSDLPILEARAWAWVGNARKFVYDYNGAEVAFERAEKLLANSSSAQASRVSGELWLYKASLRILQMRSQEAVSLADRAAKLFEDLSETSGSAKAHILKGNVLGMEGDLRGAVDNHSTGLELARLCNDRELQLASLTNLAANYASLEEVDKATVHLEMARQLIRPWSTPTVQYQLIWTEGTIELVKGRYLRAEEAYLRAREGLSDHGEIDYVAMLCLDLCILYHHMGRSAEVLELARHTIEILRPLRITRKMTAAESILVKALEDEELTSETLETIRSRFRKAIMAPPSLLPS